jgi:ankyrin repeat protein
LELDLHQISTISITDSIFTVGVGRTPATTNLVNMSDSCIYCGPYSHNYMLYINNENTVESTNVKICSLDRAIDDNDVAECRSILQLHRPTTGYFTHFKLLHRAALVFIHDDEKEHVVEVLLNYVESHPSISKRAVIDFSCERHGTALFYAVKLHNEHVLKKLLPFSQLDIRNSNGSTCLHYAVLQGTLYTVKEILKDPRVDDEFLSILDGGNRTVLCGSIMMNKVDISLAIIEHSGASLSVRCGCQPSTLHYAMSLKMENIVVGIIDNPHLERNLLATSGSPPTCRTYGGLPFVEACANGMIDAVKAILALAISSPHIGYQKGFAIACQLGHANVVDHMLNGNHFLSNLIGSFLSDFTSPYAPSFQQSTPLMHACKYPSVVQVLLQSDKLSRAAFNMVDQAGNNALMTACAYGISDVISLLLSDLRCNSDTLHRSNMEDETALTIAVHSRTPMIKVLMRSKYLSWDDIMQQVPARIMRQVASPVFDLTSTRKLRRIDMNVISDITEALARRRVMTIYAPCNQALWPHPLEGDTSGDTVSPRAALICSFFSSPIFAVDVLRIVREYI